MQDGQHAVTAYQGASSEISDFIQVEIQDGVVVPEFGAIVLIILMILIFSVVLISTKFRNQILFQ